MSYAPNYSPVTSFADDETNQASGRSTVRTASLDVEFANVEATLDGLDANQRLVQRDDGKIRDLLVEPYALAEQTRAMMAVGGKIPRAQWQPFTDYTLSDLIERNSIAYMCQIPHNSGPVWNRGFWLAISGDGSAASSAEASEASAQAAAASETAAVAAAQASAVHAASAAESAASAAVSALSAQNAADSIAGLSPVNLSAYMLQFLDNDNATEAAADLGIPSFDDLASVEASKGTALITHVPKQAGAYPSTVYDLLNRLVPVSVLNFIPRAQHAAIKAGPSVSTYDASGDFNKALEQCVTVQVPAGGYRLHRPINMTARRTGSGVYNARRLIGEGSAQTFLNCYTGGYPAIDLTGSSGCEVRGFAIRADNPPPGKSAADCPSIGIMLRRGSSSTFNQFCHNNVLSDLILNMASIPSRNGGNGVMGIVNCGGEHLIVDGVQIYANIPVVAQNVLRFSTPVASDMPTYGGEYEAPYAGAPISCTVMEFRGMRMIAWDSYRVVWFDQVAGVNFAAPYLSTRKLVSGTPLHKENFYLRDTAAFTVSDCYSETSGLFGATYRMDHRYATFAGVNDGIRMWIRRGALDQGFSDPMTPSLFFGLENGAYLTNFDLDCNYLPGTYNNSGGVPGFASRPIYFEGTPGNGTALAIKNGRIVADRFGSSSADIFDFIGPYCTNVESVNYRSGDTYLGSKQGGFSPIAFGSTTAGSASGGSTFGGYTKSGRMVHIDISVNWTSHTGTGDLRIDLNDLPFLNNANLETALAVSYSTLNVGSGKQLTAVLAQNSKTIALYASDEAGGSRSAVQVDPSVVALIISGSFQIQ